jgi:hypothetical protein
VNVVLVAEEPQEQVGGRGEQPDHGPQEPRQQHHHARRHERVAIRVAECERLGDELADHELDEDDARDHDREGCRVPEPDALERLGEDRLDLGAADDGGHRSGHRDEDRDTRQKLFWVVAQLLDRERPLVAPANELAQSRLPDGQDRDLGAGEHPVADDQSENEEEIEHPTDGPHRRTPRSVAELSAVGRRGVVRGRDGASPLARHRRQPRHRP